MEQLEKLVVDRLARQHRRGGDDQLLLALLLRRCRTAGPRPRRMEAVQRPRALGTPPAEHRLVHHAAGAPTGAGAKPCREEVGSVVVDDAEPGPGRPQHDDRRHPAPVDVRVPLVRQAQQEAAVQRLVAQAREGQLVDRRPERRARATRRQARRSDPDGCSRPNPRRGAGARRSRGTARGRRPRPRRGRAAVCGTDELDGSVGTGTNTLRNPMPERKTPAAPDGSVAPPPSRVTSSRSPHPSTSARSRPDPPGRRCASMTGPRGARRLDGQDDRTVELSDIDGPDGEHSRPAMRRVERADRVDRVQCSPPTPSSRRYGESERRGPASRTSTR